MKAAQRKLFLMLTKEVVLKQEKLMMKETCCAGYGYAYMQAAGCQKLLAKSPILGFSGFELPPHHSRRLS